MKKVTKTTGVTKKEFKKLYLKLGGENKYSYILTRYSDKRIKGQRIKFRVLRETNNIPLFNEIIKELNIIDGGGWKYQRLLNSEIIGDIKGIKYDEERNLSIYWDIFKTYNK